MTSRGWLRRIGLTQPVVIALVVLVLVATLAISFLLQLQAERNALTPVGGGTSVREQREIDKLNAEIKQIRSDTGGSLFWLKMAGLFVTVGAAVGGYLVGQSRNTRERLEAEQQVAQERLEFEHRQNIDTTYHSIVEELTVASPLLRAASAMKLGKLLQAPPVEWHLTPERERELGDLTEQILAAALAIETEPKVLKALTIALALHTPDSEAGRSSQSRPLGRSGRRRLLGPNRLSLCRLLPRRPDRRVASESAAAERAVPGGRPQERRARGGRVRPTRTSSSQTFAERISPAPICSRRTSRTSGSSAPGWMALWSAATPTAGSTSRQRGTVRRPFMSPSGSPARRLAARRPAGRP